MRAKRSVSVSVVVVVLMVLAAATLQADSPEVAAPVGSIFTYQGRLADGSGPVTGACDFRFGLWDAAGGGAQLGTTQAVGAVPVADGYFTVSLNSSGQFGSDAFLGESRYLAFAVRCTAGRPAGFADGVDNNTTYTAGQGLVLDHGEFSIPTAYLLPLGCSNGGIAEYDNRSGAWVCGVDDSGAGGTYWSLGGNLGTDPATNYLGTSDAVSLTLRVDGTPALRLAPTSGTPNLIGGSEYNIVTDDAQGAVIGGGGGTLAERNLVSDDFGTVAGGQQNQAGDDDGDPANATHATVGGGERNIAGGYYATVAGGSVNTASGWYDAIGGGYENEASGGSASIGGGWQNSATGQTATVGGGSDNQATDDGATVGGGSGNVASGEYAMIPGGTANVASGDFSFAAGRFAQANSDGCFVWGDSTANSVGCPAADRWVVQASGGVYFYTNSGLTTGSHLAAGSGTWSSLSDRNAKENLAAVDAAAVLRAVTALPITTWNYIGEAGGVQHMGPMAQDFYAAFGLGDSERHITTLDADGVALAAIQGLASQVEVLGAENTTLRAEVDALAQQNAEFEARLSALEAGGSAPAGSIGVGPWLWAGGLLLAVAGAWSFGREGIARRLGGGGR
ncbi:MAG: tail fiber domain-containing protein [Anaerolineae bacterium]